MVEIPENVRPYLELLRKYHFWMLAVAMPLVLVPLALTADSKMIGEIESQRSAIDQKLSGLDGLGRRTASGFEDLGHPHREWADVVQRETEVIRRDALTNWRRFYASQEPFRTWPVSLGKDFIQQIKAVEAGKGQLSRSMRERYQNRVRGIVRQLPARIDAIESMRDADATGTGAGFPGGVPDAGLGQINLEPEYVVDWSPEDQSRIYSSFAWNEPPSTQQIRLAQEELWVYELLCDVIKRVNEGATGPHNAVLASVEQLAVGYPAAEEDPGGQSGRRIQRPRSAGAGDEMGMAMDSAAGMGMESGGPAGGRPPNPRFSPAGQGQMGMGMGEEAVGEDPESKDAALRNWIYVDFTGQPLLAEDLESSDDAKVVRLMPFVLRGQIDQRKLDRVLTIFASTEIPIDVRQVRINPQEGGVLGMGGMGGGRSGFPGADGMMPDSMSGSGGLRRYDVLVELRGSIALVNPPDPTYLGLDPGADEAVDAEPDPEPAEEMPQAEESAAAAGPPGARRVGPGRRRGSPT